MNNAYFDHRPVKKRRFFVDDEPIPPKPSNETSLRYPQDVFFTRSAANGNEHGARQAVESLHKQKTNDLQPFVAYGGSRSLDSASPVLAPEKIPTGERTLQEYAEGTSTLSSPQPENGNSFDINLFSDVIGERLPLETVKSIRVAASGNLERAVNIYFDGSWKQLVKEASSTATTTSNGLGGLARERHGSLLESGNSTPVSIVSTQPPLRYIGAFGVAAWATTSGIGLLKHGEHISIERSRSLPAVKRGRGGKVVSNQKGDVLTRFANSSGREIGRLPRKTAEWVSTLLDQGICTFKGVCVFAPDRVRVNDTIYLQLRCYLRKEVFQRKDIQYAGDSNRPAGLFDEESTEEKNLRLRQVALVMLFDEIGLQPISINDMTKRHKKEGLLRAAEIAEHYDKVKRECRENELSGEDESEMLEEGQLDTLYKKTQFDFNMPQAEPPSTFTMDLRTYQKQALHWMLAKEKDTQLNQGKSMHPLWEEYVWPSKDADDNVLPQVQGLEQFYVNPYSGELSLEFPVQEQHCLGGILADEMGLGKTIQMLSLFHAHRAKPQDETNDASSFDRLSGLSGTPATVPAPYTTLVVAPMSLLSQWESETIKASEAGTMNVFTYYGMDKCVNLRELCKASNPAAPNIVITSYGVVLSEFRNSVSHPMLAPTGLYSVNFFRVVLDEAHLIKNRQSKSAKACYEIKATHRWIVTGTPIVNRLEDLFSLVRFLKVEPWSNFSFWKTFITAPFESKDYIRALNVVQTVLEPLVLRRTKAMKTPGGEPLVPLPCRTITIEEVDLTDQERQIYDHIFTRVKRTFNSNVEAGTLLKSFSTLFAQILRLRQSCCHPILTRNTAIVADEEAAAAAANVTDGLRDDMDLQELIDMFTATTEKAEPDGKQGPSWKFTAHVLRQIQTDASSECPICSEEPMIEPAVTGCWHSACKKCLEDFIQHQTDKGTTPRCFSCREPINGNDVFEVIRCQSLNSSQMLDDTYSSTPQNSSQVPPRISLRRIHPRSPSAYTSAKIHALIKRLNNVPAGTKSVVFSQFTSFLDLISPQLKRVGIEHLRLDGTMAQKARAEVLKRFSEMDMFDVDEEAPDSNEPPRPPPQKRITGPQVLLISLRAGGVGLNLTAASNVFMMDPWWSFAIEAQAIDRVHRMGQLRDVSVTRFVVRDSIEERMLRIQERKMNIAGSLGLRVGGDANEDEKRKERIEELKMLFE